MPLDRHRTVLALIVVCFGLFIAEDITGLRFTSGWRFVPVAAEQAWSGFMAGEWTLTHAQSLVSLITAMFLHGSIEHVLFNMVYLWAFASLTSQHLGQWWAFALFFATGICGNLLHAFLERGSEIPLLGASGAVSGFEGLYLGMALRWTLPWPDVWPLAHPIPPAQLCVFAAVGIFFDFTGLMGGGGGVAYGAHIGGFLAGLAIAWLITATQPSPEAWQRRWTRR